MSQDKSALTHDLSPTVPTFDPSRLRLPQNYEQSLGVKRILNTVPVRKPNRQDFIRVHPDVSYRLETAVIQLKEEREVYLVAPELWQELVEEIVPMVLFTTINRQETVSLWPVRLPGSDGRHDTWSSSALEAAQYAQTRWLRVAANMNLGAYVPFEATGALPEPQWPEVSFEELLRIAFKNRFVDSFNHPVVQRLTGQA